MLRYALIFTLISIIAGALGFGGIAIGATAVAQVLFYIFFILLLISLTTYLFGRK